MMKFSALFFTFQQHQNTGIFELFSHPHQHFVAFGHREINELHLPVSEAGHERAAFITLLSADTDHSFWIPRLAGKTDLIPNQINTTWKQLRALSQDRHCLVVTATQANAGSYTREAPMDRRSFSEDKRKLAHATGISTSRLQEFEQGTREPTSRQFEALAEIYGVP